jgi:uncharacterized membrane protein
MSQPKLLSTAGRLAARTLMVLAAAGLVIASVFLPVYWTGASHKALQQAETLRLRIPPQYRERAERERLQVRERHAPALQGLRLIFGQLVGITIFALIGRRILGLRLKR